MKVDGEPVRNWKEALEKIQGPGEHLGTESDMSGHVFAAGESVSVFTPHNPENNPLNFDKSNPLWVKMNKDRLRVTVEICYCSTLDALGEQFPAVVEKVKDGLLQFAITGMDVGGEALLMDDFPA